MTAVAGARAGERAPAAPMTMALVVTLVSVMVVLDTTIVNIAVGTLARDFHASLATIQWVGTGYLLGLATIIPTTAWAVGRFGTRRVYLASIALFTAGSALCGLAWDVPSLVGFRVVQGLGGGMLIPVGMTIVLRAAGPGANGRLMAMLGLPPLIGPLIGPVLGGLLLDHASWRLIFLVNPPIGVAGLVLAARLLPADTDRTAHRLDLVGLLLLSPGLALLLYGLTGGGTPFTVTGLALGAAFLVRAATTAEPLIQLRLFRRRRLAASAATLTLMAAAYFGSMLLMPLYFQTVRGLDPTTTALLAIPQVLTTGLTMQVATRLVDRVPPGRIVALGTIVAPIGVLLLLTHLTATVPYWQPVSAMAVMGVGIGLTLMPATAAGTRGLAHDEAPAASTGLMILQQVGAATGTAVLSARLGRQITARLPGVHDLGQAYALPANARPALAAAFQHTYTWGAVLMAATLLPAILLPLRHPPRDRDLVPAATRSSST